MNMNVKELEKKKEGHKKEVQKKEGQKKVENRLVKPSKGISLCDVRVKFEFKISDLYKYSYKHNPVPSMKCDNQPLQEIIQIIPLKNLLDKNDDHEYTLTYIYYKTPYSFDGYGYITCNFFKCNTVRANFTVTSLTTQILAQALFDIGKCTCSPIPVIYTQKLQEDIFLFDNSNSKIVPVTLILEGDSVTLESR